MYTITRHAAAQIEAKGFNAQDVYAVASRPSIAYENRRVPGQMRHCGRGIAVVVDPNAQKIITVYANVVETDQRADQTDADAVRHFNDRKRREAKRRERQERDRQFTAMIKNKKG